jgi:proteasome lid subunit RPN8/RPN11
MDESDKAKAGTKRFPGGGVKPDPGEQRIAFDKAAYAQLIGHAVVEPDIEVCGVLVGRLERDADGEWIDITNVIKGVSAKQEGTQVTFTHDTWNHIHAEMDRLYADKEIVGWYHTHGGFGIFLSEMDTFIHQNFFSASHHLAYVYDPLAGTEGFFRKVDDKLKPVRRYWLGGRERVVVMRTAAESAAESGGDNRSAAPSQDFATALQRISQTLQMLAISRDADRVPLPLWLAVAAAVVMSGYVFLRPPNYETGAQPGGPRPLLVLQRDSQSRQAVGVELHAVLQQGDRIFRDETGQVFVGIDPAQVPLGLDQLLSPRPPATQNEVPGKPQPTAQPRGAIDLPHLSLSRNTLTIVLVLAAALVLAGSWLFSRGWPPKKKG